MRTMGMALVGLLLASGVAMARAVDAGPADTTVQTHRLHRWAFDARGPSESDVAYRDCPGDKLVSVNSRKTAVDWTAAVVTLGWYTPAHTTVRCAH